MRIKNEIKAKQKTFKDLCIKHKVKSIYAFGSSTTDKFNSEKSDIDLIVEIDDPDPIEKGDKLLSLWDKLEEFFHRKVDLLTESSIKNPILKRNINSTKILIYDGTGQKVFI